MTSKEIKTIIHPNCQKVPDTVAFLSENRVQSHNSKLYPEKVVNLDFSQSGYVEPYHIAPLACLINEYLEEGYSFELCGVHDQLMKFFKESGFYDFCRGKYEESSFPTPIDINILPLWRISDGAHNMYPKEAEKYYNRNAFLGKDLQPLNTALGEMMNNVFDHSECRIPGYTVTQHHPNRRQIFTCVCDFGISIPVAVNRFLTTRGEAAMSPIDAIVRATELNFSTLSQPHNRGRGLDTLISIVDSLQGRIQISSGGAVFSKLAGQDAQTELLEYNFPGTMVVIELNTDVLSAKEDEISDDLHIFE